MAHAELGSLSIAHVDCDAFYASIEKRDNPDLEGKPVIVGSKSGRGVVTTCCYVARKFGVRSAMPMWEALKKCPDAHVIPPRFGAYREASRAIRDKFEALTPLVEPLSLDEAYLDLTNTEKLHGMPPAMVLLRLAQEIRQEVGITVSIGLSYAKFLAKLASDMEKPFGFSVIGHEAPQLLAQMPVSKVGGIGRVAQRGLEGLGIVYIGQLREVDPKVLVPVLGDQTFRFINYANGIDSRKVTPPGQAKSVSNETTLERDIVAKESIRQILWPLCEKVSARMKEAGLWGETVTLKLKDSQHKVITRQVGCARTQLAEDMFQAGVGLLEKMPSVSVRLVGIGMSGLHDNPGQQGLFGNPNEATERAMDAIRQKFGTEAIRKGRGL